MDAENDRRMQERSTVLHQCREISMATKKEKEEERRGKGR
jgi:hypothetical protein